MGPVQNSRYSSGVPKENCVKSAMMVLYRHGGRAALVSGKWIRLALPRTLRLAECEKVSHPPELHLTRLQLSFRTLCSAKLHSDVFKSVS